MKNYQNFWQTLVDAYPVSKWTLRLPIATRYLEIKDVNIYDYRKEFQNILNQLIDAIEKEWRESIAIKNWQPEIIPFLGKDFSGVIRFDCMLNTDWELKIIEAIGGTKWVFKNHEAYKKLFESDISIFIAIPNDAFFLDAYYTEYQFLQNLWYTVFIWSIDKLTQQDGNIYFQWEIIHAIRRCIEVGKIEKWVLEILK